MKIGFFNSYRLWGGGEKWHYDMIEHAISEGDECFLFSPFDGELKERVSNSFGDVICTPIAVNKYTYLNPLNQWEFVNKFKKYNLDILVFNSFVDTRAAAMAAKKAGIKNVVLRVGTPIAPAQKKSYINSFQFGVDHIVGISDEIINVFKRDAPEVVKGISFYKIPNGIDVDTLSPTNQKNGIYTFGNCCRLTEQKGIPYLIDAVVELKKITDKPFKVKIAGKGEEEDALKDLVKLRGVEDITEFVGHVEDIEVFYNSIDTLSFTSEHEGTARTILEAWSCEKPVISFDISSMKEMISPGEDGILIPPYHIEEYAQAMADILDNPEKYKLMGEAGRTKVLESYNKVIQYQKWYDYLTSL